MKDDWETAGLGPNPSHESFGNRFGQFGAFRPAIGSAFWNPGETAVSGQIVARSLLETDLGNLAPFGRLLEVLSGILGKRPLWAKSSQGAFWSGNLAFWTTPGRRLSLFWNHWETATLTQILARTLLEADAGNLAPSSWLLKVLSGILGKRPLWAKSWPGAF